MAKSNNPKGAGRKNKYYSVVLPKMDQIIKWCEEGLTDMEIAKRLGIHITSLINYKKEHEELAKAMQEAKEIADYRVEDALYKRAIGYKYKEVTRQLVEDARTGKTELKVVKEVIKEVAPDTTAQIFWLKNRQPQKWRDKQEQHITAEVKSVEQFLEEMDKNKNNEGEGDYEY